MNRIDSASPLITDEVRYQWKLVRDCLAGEKRMKDRAEEYLPKKGGQTDCDYERYKARAKWADYTEQALNTMHGMICRKEPTVMIPDNEQLEACLENFNREGDSLYQFASDSAYDNMQTSFGGFLVDMPYNDEVLTEQDAIDRGLRPYCKYYPGEDVYDFKYRNVNAARQLVMVKLRETVETDDGGEFGHTLGIQYRIYDLYEGYCRVRVFREFVDDKTREKVYAEIGDPIPLRIRGQLLDYIPFYFAPNKKPVKPMLYGVAELNKHYYMQSADYENGIHYTTIPTGYSIGHIMEVDDKKRPIPIKLGGDSWLNFSETEAKVGTLSFSGEGLSHCESALESTQEQIGILGTRAISPDKAMSETSDAAKIHRQGENAKLATYARNLSETFTKILRVMADWMGVPGNVSVSFNVDFDTATFDPNMMNSIANLSREFKYPIPLVWEALDRGELLPVGFTLREFATLCQLERAGATPVEVVEAYIKMKNGEDIEVEGDVPVDEIPEDEEE